MEKQMINILYVDDEVHNLVAFRAAFRRSFNIFTAESAKEALVIMQTETFHIIVSDQRMPVMTGVDFFQSIIANYPDPVRILLTGYADINAVIDAINNGQVYMYINKPWQEKELKMSLEKAFELFALRRENKRLQEQLSIVNEQLEFMFRQKLIS